MVPHYIVLFIIIAWFCTSTYVWVTLHRLLEDDQEFKDMVEWETRNEWGFWAFLLLLSIMGPLTLCVLGLSSWAEEESDHEEAR